MKRCTKCQIDKEDWEFASSNRPDGLSCWCRKCLREYNYNNAESRRAQSIFYKFGITIADFENILEKQGGVCAICGRSETKKNCNGKIQPLSIDHDHKTMKVRGLICHKCNTRLGILDDEAWVQKAQTYLERNK